MYTKVIFSSLYLFLYYLFVVLPREILGKNKLILIPEEQSYLRKTILCFSYIEWDATFQRPHHLVYGFSNKYTVFYCTPVRVHNVESFSWALKNFERNVSESLTVLIPLVIPGERLFKSKFLNQIIRNVNNKLVLTQLVKYLNKKGIANLTIYTNSPFFLDVIKRLKYNFLIYDVMDDLIALPGATSNASEIEDELFKLADLVYTGTYSLYELKKNKHKNIHFVQCGVDYSHFSMQEMEEREMPFDIQGIKRPIIGYFGALNERLDCELIEKIAHERKDWSLVMIGPKYESVVDLPQNNNIHYLGKKHYRDLPKYLREFDVAIVPYTLKGGTKFVNPVKILEYLAGGKPVVSTEIPDVKRFFAEYVYIAKDDIDFIKKIEEALRSNSIEVANSRKEFAKKRSWEMMIEEMIGFYTKSYKQKLNTNTNHR